MSLHHEIEIMKRAYSELPAVTLPRAIAAFIEAGCDRTKMLVPAWAQTYRCEFEAVRHEWERQMTVKSQTPDNAYETEGK